MPIHSVEAAIFIWKFKNARRFEFAIFQPLGFSQLIAKGYLRRFNINSSYLPWIECLRNSYGNRSRTAAYIKNTHAWRGMFKK